MIKLKADFSELDKIVEKAIREAKLEAAKELSKIGIQYQQTARTKGDNMPGLKEHQDWTQVLRTSHAFAVYLDGELVYGSSSSTASDRMFERMKTGKGLELIVGNGTEYASWVEGKGFDVSASGFLKVMKEVQKLFN